MEMGTLGSLLLNTSILFRKRMIEVRRNHLELITDSKRTRDSAMRFYGDRLISLFQDFGGLVTHLVLLLEQDLIVFG